MTTTWSRITGEKLLRRIISITASIVVFLTLIAKSLPVRADTPFEDVFNKAARVANMQLQATIGGSCIHDEVKKSLLVSASKLGQALSTRDIESSKDASAALLLAIVNKGDAHADSSCRQPVINVVLTQSDRIISGYEQQAVTADSYKTIETLLAEADAQIPGTIVQEVKSNLSSAKASIESGDRTYARGKLADVIAMVVRRCDKTCISVASFVDRAIAVVIDFDASSVVNGFRKALAAGDAYAALRFMLHSSRSKAHIVREIQQIPPADFSAQFAGVVRLRSLHPYIRTYEVASTGRSLSFIPDCDGQWRISRF